LLAGGYDLSFDLASPVCQQRRLRVFATTRKQLKGAAASFLRSPATPDPGGL
jgi:hypothetical protein